MFFKILKKELKQKKSMNILLFLFMILTAMLLGSSITMLSTVTSATSNFVKEAKITDFVSMVYSDPKSDQVIADWLTDNKLVKEYFIQKDVILAGNMLEVPKNRKKFEYGNMLGLMKMPQDTNLIFDENSQPFTLKEGEIAIPYLLNDKTGLSIGDTLTINAYGVTKEFKVVHYTKDAYTGSSVVGFKRLIVSDMDYNTFNNEKASILNNVCVNVADGHKLEELESEFTNLSVNSMWKIDRNMYGMLYMMEMIVAAIMAIVSIFLIVISLIVLRFTIMFTIQEDYKQIGIMKAIGLKDNTVRSIYMVKYFMLSLVGGTLGYMISIPLGKNLTALSCRAMVLRENSYFNWMSLLAVGSVIGFTILYCKRCTGRIAKVSAIEAIRNGSNGERFTKLSKVSLHKKGRMGISTYLAISDITNNFRRYGVLVITFILGTMILLIPINCINTLKDKSMVRLFGQVDFDVDLRAQNETEILYSYSYDQVSELMEKVQKEYQQAGIPVDLFMDISYMGKVYKDDPNNSKIIYTNVSHGIDSSEYTVEEGVPAKLENEVVLTKQVAKYFGVGVGDKVHIYVANKEREFIVSGLNETILNMGESMRLGSQSVLSMDGCTGFSIFGRFTKEGDYKEAMKNVDSNFDIKESMDYVTSMIGSVISILEVLRMAILIVILVINFIITMLIVRMMLVKETAEVAILKSIGFRNRTIRGWQVKRMLYILVISVILGTIFVALFGSNVVLIIFKMLGVTKLSLVIKPLEVFVIYPLVIMVDVSIAVFVSTMDIKRIKVWEINNQE